MTAVNGGFWDLPQAVRAEAEAQAAADHHVPDFFDLDPASRQAAYERAVTGYYGQPGD